jgi:DNA-binding MarR family transcriptional regulator
LRDCDTGKRPAAFGRTIAARRPLDKGVGLRPCRRMTDTPSSPDSSPSTPYRLHESLGYNLTLAARRQERRLDEKLRLIGLTRTTWCILLAVGNEGMTQPSDIAAFVGIDRTATSRALRSMESDGLLARHSGTEDRRTRQIELTEKGNRVLLKGTPFARENGRLLRALLTPDEHAELTRLLNVLIEGTPAELQSI